MKKIFTALTSAFKADGTLDEVAMKAMIDYNIDVSKVDGLYINGSTGEFPMLSFEMKVALLTYVKKQVKNRVDLIAQIGSTSIFETIELGQIAKKLGYTKLSCIAPFYFKVNFAAQYAYYEKIASTLKIDFYPYYIPGLTNVTFTNEEIKKILNLNYVKGIKFSDTNVQKLHEVRKQNPDKIIYFGWDEMMISGLMANVDGFIGSTYALNGLNARKLIQAFEANDIEKVQKLIDINLDIISKLVANNLMETIKYAIYNHYEITTNAVNILPTIALSDAQKAAIPTLVQTIKEVSLDS